jgi:hypothetical protein
LALCRVGDESRPDIFPTPSCAIASRERGFFYFKKPAKFLLNLNVAAEMDAEPQDLDEEKV